MRSIIRLAVLSLAFLTGAAQAQETLMLRQPAVAEDQLAFVYAGDLWVADRDGGNPRRLTTSAAEERDPSFSPDGRWIAYAGRFENNTDVYVISVDGGQPRRLTWHQGGDHPTGWTADGSAVTFVSARETDHGRSGQLYSVPLAGGAPVKRMAARVYRGVLDGEDRRFAYMAHGSGYNGLFGGSAGWKGYRGGTTPAIRIMDLAAESVITVPGAGATNFNPLWLGDTLYFLSDRVDKTFNLFRWEPSNGAVVKVSDESDWDIVAAAGHGDRIVYEAGGRLKELNLASGRTRDLPIAVAPDLPQLREHWKDAAETLQHAAISPSGERALLTARGEVFTVPTDEGSTRNLTATDGVREYTALWAPGGERIAWIEEALDGQTLVLQDQAGLGEPRRLPLGPHFHELLAWSPDDARIVFRDNHLALHAISLADGDIETLAVNARRQGFEVAFSPDSRWLAYTLEQPNFHRDLVLHDFRGGRRTTVTDGDVDVAAPAFSRDGKYLFFAGSTNSGPTQVGLNMTSQERPYRAGLYAAVLAADGESPLLPGAGDEPANGDDEEEAGDGKDEDEQVPETTVDLDGLSRRIVGLPVAKKNYGELAVAEDGNLYFVEFVQPGAQVTPPGEDAAADNRLARFDFEHKEAQPLLDGVDDFELSADGQQLLVRKTDGSLVFAEVSDELEPEALALDGVRLRVDPRREWAQIFDEVWRMEKEYFYADNLHGLDWDAVYDRYRPLVDHVGRREDLNALLVMMIAELQAGHNRVGGGDVHEEADAETGLLGANFEVVNDRYRITKIYTGESWNPFLAAPLATPGNAAIEGEYLLAINGQALTADDNLFARLQGTRGQQVTLRVGPDAGGRGARNIVVEPVEDERLMRLWAWIEANRAQVDEATDGRVGYVYLPNTAGAGYTLFNRMFFAQLDREALIVDERSNGGGQAANYITEVLSRRHLSGWKDRDGLVYNTPAGAMHGPKVMLIDQDAGSGGDYLPWSFRHLGIGPLIGTRTWGGLIGIFANPRLIDGGVVTVPYFRFFDPDGNWTVENEGVAPDLEVELDPIASNAGRDTQLEFAIEEVLRRLEDFEPTVPAEAPPLPTELGR